MGSRHAEPLTPELRAARRPAPIAARIDARPARHAAAPSARGENAT